MFNLMTSGGGGQYDMVSASGDASLRLIYANAVQEVNVKLIPAWKDFFKAFQSPSNNTVDGKHYGVSLQFCPNVLMVNKKAFKKAPTSWGALYDPKNKGKITVPDNPIQIADAALYLSKTKPSLGIKDPYELNEKQYAEVLKVLRQQKQLAHRYWHDVTVQMNDFKNECVAASSAWPYQVNALKAEKQPINSTIPTEGSTGWADTTMLHTSAANPVCAYKWMEWSLNKNLQSALAEWFGSNPVVPDACKTAAPGGGDFCKTNGFERFEQVHFWKTPVAKCASQGTCVPYSKWTQDYIGVMGGR
jgi:putative spermidine/putrescine transport system substrate-binding protein